ncbi:MAG: HTH domain-containing protein [Deltaproteobacteria bacterium]|nr:HTH domain-containing protein [Deltaproteobacteria bacterium]
MLNALKQLNYQAVLAIEAARGTKDQFEAYLVVRAAIILGQFEKATGLLAKYIDTLEGEESFFVKFLRQQLQFYSEARNQDACMAFLSLRPAIPLDTYFQAEFHFVLGYVFNELDEYKQGTRYHRLASELYAQAGLQACQAIALFNLCVSYDHLNEKSLLEATIQTLGRLADSTLSKPVRSAYLQLSAYGKRAREDFEGTYQDVRTLLDLEKEAGRYRDCADLACLCAYLLLKLNKNDEFDAFIDRNKAENYFSQLTRGTLSEYEVVAHMGLISETDIRRLLTRWKRLRIEGIHFVGLLSLVADLLMKSRQYELLARFAHQASQLSIQFQQAFCMMDFRYYEVWAITRMGDLGRARMLLSLYKQDATDDLSDIRLSKANSLQQEIEQASEPDELGSSRILLLDMEAHTLAIGASKRCLLRKPLVEKFLFLLIHNRRQWPIPALFEQLYGVSFNPFLHERRLGSLFDRTRAILGGSNFIIRRDSHISLSNDVQATVKSVHFDFEVEKRQRTILNILEQSTLPMTISELETKFRCSRRTIQGDLKSLVHSKLILCHGNTRLRRYFVSH